MTEITNIGCNTPLNCTIENPINGFPIRDDLRNGEAGHGYVLRMAVANHLNGVPTVKAMLGKTRFSVMDESDASRIAIWFGADPDRLAVALGSTGIGRNADNFLLYGHTLSRSYFINRMYPRICIKCIEESALCRAEWDLSLVATCAHHGLVMLDACQYCGSSLSWNRPAVNICKCGCAFAFGDESICGSTMEREFAKWAGRKISDSGLDINSEAAEMERQPDLPLIRLIQPMSLNGGLNMVYAFGTAQRNSQIDVTAMHRKKSSVAAARDILQNASAFVDQLNSGRRIEFVPSSLSVVRKLLAESASAANNPADRSMAYSLIGSLLHQSGRSNWKSSYPQLSQLELF
jgi:hypothetical protein